MSEAALWTRLKSIPGIGRASFRVTEKLSAGVADAFVTIPASGASAWLELKSLAPLARGISSDRKIKIGFRPGQPLFLQNIFRDNGISFALVEEGPRVGVLIPRADVAWIALAMSANAYAGILWLAGGLEEIPELINSFRLRFPRSRS